MGPMGVQGAPGSPGAQGSQGPSGPTGPVGPAGASPFSLNGTDTYYTQGNVRYRNSQPQCPRSLRVEESRQAVGFPWLCPPFPASCPFRSTHGTTGYLLPHRPHRADVPQRVPQADSPVTSKPGESEAAATDAVVGAQYIAPTSAGFRACDDSATSSRSLRRPDRTSEGSESSSVGRSTGSGLGAWR